MFKLFRTFLLILFLMSTTTAVYSETSWITKKSDKTKKEIKKEKIEKTEYIKKKKKEIKKNKKEFKKEEKKISKEVKSWITKKTKEKYIDSIDKLPDDAIYFTGVSNISGLIFYGYVKPDTKSKLISNYYETSTGFGYFNDGKAICKIGSTVLIVLDGEVTARISGNCNNGLKFTGKTTQTLNSGWGSAKTADGTDRFDFDFNNDRTIIAEIFNENDKKLIARGQIPLPKSKIQVNPPGKYYALLIGNSNYAAHGQWASQKSPVNDITEIGNILKQKYKFEKVITIKNANRKEIFKGFNDLSKLSTDNDYVLIYYSGHGDIITNQSYWIPIDGEKGSGSWNWVNINDIQNYIKNDSPNEILARHLVIMSDSCYFAIETKGNKLLDNKIKTYNKLLLRKARIIVASGSNEPVEDTNQDHSMFGMSFIQALKNNEDVIKMSEIIENIMFAHAGMNQQPYGAIYAGHGGGDFLFVVKKQIK